MSADYFEAGHAERPEDIVLGSSQLLHFLLTGPYHHPRLFHQRFVGTQHDPAPPSADAFSGWCLDRMLLSGLEPEKLPAVQQVWVKKERETVILEGALKLGDLYLPPAWIGRGSNRGKAAFELSKTHAEGLGLTWVAVPDYEGRPSISSTYKALGEASAIQDYLRASTSRDYDDAPGGLNRRLKKERQHQESLPLAAQWAWSYLLNARGTNHARYEAEWNGVKLRTEIDRELDDDGALLDLKRIRKAAPAQFWRWFGESGERMRFAFREYVANHQNAPCEDCEGEGRVASPLASQCMPAETCETCAGDGHLGVAGEDGPRQWVIVATYHKPVPQAWAYVMNPNDSNQENAARARQQQKLGRLELQYALENYHRCLTSGRWETPAEALGVQPAEAPSHWEYRSEYETLKDPEDSDE